MEFVLIPAGNFMMGSEDGEDDEKPKHKVVLTRPFYLSKYEVTQGQWEAVMGSSPWSGRNEVSAGQRYPAVYVSWGDSQAFLTKLCLATGQNGFRLSTEAEWEYACRAGATSRYPSGDHSADVARYGWFAPNVGDTGEKRAHLVGLKEPNVWGLYDMIGNAYEWCQDWYGPYGIEPQTDPRGPGRGSHRARRGGCFTCPLQCARSAKRSKRPPTTKGNAETGFRCAILADVSFGDLESILRGGN